MDPFLSKMIVSKRKSIALLRSRIVEFEAKSASCTVPSLILFYRDLARIDSKRLSKLEDLVSTLVAASSLDDRQGVIPGSELAPAGGTPPARGTPPGEPSRRR